MARPRPVVPGTTQLVTRSTSQQQYLLKPTAFVRLVLTFCLAYAAWKYKVQVHAVAVMSNHFHVVCTDVAGRLPQFMHWLDLQVAKILNLHWKRRQNFFDNRQHQPQILADADAVRRTMLYVLMQPVAAGVVPTSREWDGLITRLEELAGATRRIERPSFFRKKGPVAPFAFLRHTVPPHFAHLTPTAWRDLVAADLAAAEAEAQATRAAEGRSFTGMAAALRIPHTHSPQHRHDLGIRPQVIASSHDTRQAILDFLRAFRDAYSEALARWRAGDRLCHFPPGTWAMRVLHAAPCYGIPTDGKPPP